jgi:YcaO-like protein with predicted kinase domain
MTTPIRHRVGTYRSVDPSDTWSRIAPELHRFGITRVGDITDLDEIGIPTFVAYRPDGATIAVSIGTGLDPMQAMVSAAMESIEVWHAENPERRPEFRAAAADLDLPYDLRALNIAPHSPLTEHSVLDWTTGIGLLSGQEVPVPLESVQIDFTGGPSWGYALFQPTTNGVASGNTPDDATLHGLMEVMERECITEYLATDTAELRYCDIDGVSSEYLSRIIARLRAAGCSIAVVDITNRLEIPCYAAVIWSADVPFRCGGFGCHIEAEIAAGRALLEAALLAEDPTAYAREKGLPIQPGAVVRIDTTQHAGPFGHHHHHHHLAVLNPLGSWLLTTSSSDPACPCLRWDGCCPAARSCRQYATVTCCGSGRLPATVC